MKHTNIAFLILMAGVLNLTLLPAETHAQIFTQDLAFLEKEVLPVARENNHETLVNFIENILPKLNQMFDDKRYNIGAGINRITADPVLQKDFMIYAYKEGRRKAGSPFGKWNDSVTPNLLFILELLCPIKEFLNLKPEKYSERMSEINTKLVKNSYSRTLKSLSLLPAFYNLHYVHVESSGRFPQVDKLFIVPLITFADQQRVDP